MSEQKSRNSDEWKELSGFIGYFINENGEIKSTLRGKDTLMKPQFCGNGYYYVNLIRNKIQVRRSIHTLVADTFLGERGGLDVDHIDGDKSNNSLKNLRILTRSQNLKSYRDKKQGATSQYRGVSWDAINKKWLSRIRTNGKLHYLGHFFGEKAAGLVYDCAAKRFGFNKEALNFG